MQGFCKTKKSRLGNATGEKGNVIFLVLIAISIIAMLTWAVGQTTDQEENFANNASDDEQIGRMLTYAGTLANTISQLVIAGARTETLYTLLNVSAPNSGVAYTAGAHNLKLFHPMGGGMNYITETGNPASSSTVATDYKINKTSIITGVGATDVVVGDVVFTAKVTSLKACQRINFLLKGVATVPVLATASFDNLFTNGLTVTVAAGNCASCVNVAQQCVSNTAADAFGYYSVLLPG